MGEGEAESGAPDLVALVRDSLGPDSGGGPAAFRRLLAAVAIQTGADGCILWAAAPAPNADPAHRPERLYARAGWFRNSRARGLLSHDLPYLGSESGLAMQAGSPRCVAVDRTTVPGRLTQLKDLGFTALCVFPMALGPTPAALNLYFGAGHRVGEAVVRRSEAAAALVPALYGGVRERSALRLLWKLEHDLRGSDEPKAVLSDAREEWVKLVRRVGTDIAAAFDVLEVSLFLVTDPDRRARFQLVHSTFPEVVAQTAYSPGTGGGGLTQWVVDQRRPVRVFDKLRLQRDLAMYQQWYEGLGWRDEVGFERLMRRHFKLEPREEVPPISAMVVPVLTGSRLHGVVRVCAPRDPPYYFSEDDLKNLEVAAGQLGRAWGTWLDRRRHRRLKERWRTLSARSTRLNEEFLRDPGDSGSFAALAQGVARLTANLLPMKSANVGVRMVGPDGRLARVASIGPGFLREPAPAMPVGAAAAALTTGQPASARRGTADFEPIVAGAAGQLSVPLALGAQGIGVLDVWTGDGEPLGEEDQRVVLLLAGQLAVCHALGRLVGSVRDAAEKEAQAFQDLSHQLKTPVFQAIQRSEQLADLARDLLPTGSDQDRLVRELSRVTGLFRRARRVAGSVGVLAAAARSEPMRLSPRPVDGEQLVRVLLQGVTDAQLLIDPAREVDVRLDRESVAVALPPGSTLVVDVPLLEQALDCLLDNATKYCFPETTIALTVERADGVISIVVASEGIALRPGEVEQARTRGWRAERARHVAGEGSGIGLFIVDQIMRAHRGALAIRPTERDITQVALRFPG